VHVLHLDVEGHEDQILNAIDFSQSRPLIIIYEISHMPESTKQQLASMLRSHGYQLREAGIDCVATLRDFD
jgi:hypothetical protein